MKNNQITTVILIYCTAIFLGAVAFAISGSNNNKNTEIGPTPSVMAENQIAEGQISPAPTGHAEAPTPTPVNIEGPVNWQQFASELDFDWASISDRPCLLIKKPSAIEGLAVEGEILIQSGQTLEFVMKNCVYTEIYYSSIERRANGHYYNAQPPVIKAEESEGAAGGTDGVQTSVNDIMSDPVRKLSSMILKDKNGGYNITVRLTMDAEYVYTLYETASFYAISLSKGQ